MSCGVILEHGFLSRGQKIVEDALVIGPVETWVLLYRIEYIIEQVCGASPVLKNVQLLCGNSYWYPRKLSNPVVVVLVGKSVYKKFA